jgi:hypothetical protein
MATSENHPESSDKDGQVTNEPESEEIDYAGILNKTLKYSPVQPGAGTTLANLQNVPSQTQKDTVEKADAGSTVQEDNNFLNKAADLRKKRREAMVQMKKTGRHPR